MTETSKLNHTLGSSSIISTSFKKHKENVTYAFISRKISKRYHLKIYFNCNNWLNCVWSRYWRTSLHSQRPNISEHGRTCQGAGRGTSVILRPLNLLQMLNRRIPRHIDGPLATSILPRVLHLRNHWFHIWKCSCSFSKLYHPPSPATTWSIQCHNRARSCWSISEHRDLYP